MCGVFQPMDVIKSTISEVRNNNSHLLENLLEAAMRHNPGLATPIMQAIVEQGRPLRPHYFWPLIKRAVNNDNPDGEQSRELMRSCLRFYTVSAL